jgi:hypothetical protein
VACALQLFFLNSAKSNFFVKILMMKKQYFKVSFLAGILFFVFNVSAHAQVDSIKAAKLQEELADTICTCISQTDTSTIKTIDDVQALFMKCFMGNGMNIFMEYCKASGTEMSDMNAMQDVLTKIGMQLSINCPAMLELTLKVVKSSDYEKLMQEYKDATQPDNKTPPQNKN